ncbi:ribonuclease P protein component [Puia dinghuensis]|uniref:Ribonuclease P protein component n=1 Tax=Puia dinghuensis TaxID=1792502 RepID=A0A8J2UF88_9BACT|nr:ribonuclease P protein component [Puia dinghuensis]GGB09515.1 ribonuclease P protein component [Puia dinghuensis]
MAAHRTTWKKAEKLKSRKRIERVFREGKSFSVFPYKVVFLLSPATPPLGPRQPSPGSVQSPSAPPPSHVSPPTQALSSPSPRQAPLQAGFGASSRHFKKAVDRNRIKRLGREAYRLQKAPLLHLLAQKGLSMAVFFVFTGKELPDYATVTAKIAVALQKLMRETK